ncbi:MAG: adenylate/guanylate cyclase domain-containing protein [Chloroflexi bacterium]|nr:adenylate/guanylate cyclase domain-containing protein [Chloroflexota bacterium]
MQLTNAFPLAHIEPSLRELLPADLYAAAWLDPSPETLTDVFHHLRTLRYILQDYVPRQVAQSRPKPGQITYQWQEGAFIFTDLSGFTPLMEATAPFGKEGAVTLHNVLNGYFASMIEIISLSGGTVLEFTGDAMLALFRAGDSQRSMEMAVRAGLRMQRSMQENFAEIETPGSTHTLAMRVGIHPGRFFRADIGTPRRMEHVLLGQAVRKTKRAEAAGVKGRVCVTEEGFALAAERFRFEDGEPGHKLVVDDFSADELGEYDITMKTRRPGGAVLFDRSVDGLVHEIEDALQNCQPLASYMPRPILTLLVESASERAVPAEFMESTVMFANLVGLAEIIDEATPDEERSLVSLFSQILTLINAAVEARGGILKQVTYHLSGSDIMIFFGVPTAHSNDSLRAAEAALIVRDIITNLKVTTGQGEEVELSCEIGLARGPVFAAEVGEPRGRREYNIQGDTVNTAARLMVKAPKNEIWMTEGVYEDIQAHFDCTNLGIISLKGKSATKPIYRLNHPIED